ncbi:hypothetical protein T484DRAFT_1757952, partial [Baffinella frigidus]
MQLTMSPERTQYVTQGPDGLKRLKDGPNLSKYRGLSIINSRSFSTEAGARPRDLLDRRVRVAEYYAIKNIKLSDLKTLRVKMYDQSKDTMFIIGGMELMEKCILPSEMEAWRVLKDFIRGDSQAWDHREILEDYRGTIDDDSSEEDFPDDDSSLPIGGGSIHGGGDTDEWSRAAPGNTSIPGGSARPHTHGGGFTGPTHDGSTTGPPQGGGAGRGGPGVGGPGRGGFGGGGAARRQDDPSRSNGGAARQDEERERRAEADAYRRRAEGGAARQDGGRYRQGGGPGGARRAPLPSQQNGSKSKKNDAASSTWLGVAKLAYDANMPTAKYMQENNVSMTGSEGGCYSLDNALTTMPYVWDLTAPRPKGTMMPTSLETINKLIPSVTNEMINFMLQPIDIADLLATPAKLDNILCRVLAPAMGIPYLETGAVEGQDWENPQNKAHPANSPYKYSRLFMINAYMAAHGTEDVHLFEGLKIIETGLKRWCGANNSAEGLHKLATYEVNGTENQVFKNMLFSPAENTCFTEAWSKWFEARPTEPVNDPEFLLYATRSCMHGLFMHKDHLYTKFTMNATRGVMLGVDFDIYADVDDDTDHHDVSNKDDFRGRCSFRNSWDKKKYDPSTEEDCRAKYARMRRNLDLNSSGNMYPKPSDHAFARYVQHERNRKEME